MAGPPALSIVKSVGFFQLGFGWIVATRKLPLSLCSNDHH